MVRKKRTDSSGAGEGSQSQEAGGNTGRGQQRPATVRPPQQAQQGGGYQQGGRGWSPQFQQGRGGYGDGGGYPQGQGRGFSQPRGGAPQQYGGPPAGYQVRGSQPQGMPFQQRGGGFPESGGKRHDGGSMPSGRGGGYSSAGPSRPSPELHQATVAPYQATVTTPHESSSQAGPSSRSPEPSLSTIVNQTQQLSLQSEGTSTQAIQPIAASSKSEPKPKAIDPNIKKKLQPLL